MNGILETTLPLSSRKRKTFARHALLWSKRVATGQEADEPRITSVQPLSEIFNSICRDVKAKFALGATFTYVI